jgi:sec-independent protein translocase protein TatA
MPMGLGTTELLVILGIVILLFGPKKLPELATGIGKALRSLRKGARADDMSDAASEPEETSSAPRDALRTPTTE